VQPEVPPLPSLEMEGQLKDMNQGLAQVDAALVKIEAGGNQLANGQGQMSEGLGAIASGLDKLILLNKAQILMVQGALTINQKIVEAVSPLADNPVMGDLVKQLLTGLDKQKELLSTIINGGEMNGQQVPAMSVTGEKLGEVKAGLTQIAAGTDTAKAGAGKIGDAVSQVRRQGIGKMRNGVASSLREVQAGNSEKKLLAKLVKDYDVFLGKPSGAKGKVQFVLQTEELSK
jgi:putative membrane protein